MSAQDRGSGGGPPLGGWHPARPAQADRSDSRRPFNNAAMCVVCGSEEHETRDHPDTSDELDARRRIVTGIDDESDRDAVLAVFARVDWRRHQQALADASRETVTALRPPGSLAIPSVCDHRWHAGRLEVPTAVVEHVCALTFAEHHAKPNDPHRCSCGVTVAP
jgi:hypothetical protein